MKHNITAQITLKKYAEQQIQKYLNEAIVYEAQIAVVTKTLVDKDKKENAIKALTALNQQIEAGKAALKSWEEYYDSLPIETTLIAVE